MFYSMQITKLKVDSFKLGQRLPSCQLIVKWSGEGRPADLMYMVELQGAKKPSNFFHIMLHCDSISEGMSLHDFIMLLYIYSKFAYESFFVLPDVIPPAQKSSHKRRHEHTCGEGEERRQKRDSCVTSKEEAGLSSSRSSGDINSGKHLCNCL